MNTAQSNSTTNPAHAQLEAAVRRLIETGGHGRDAQHEVARLLLPRVRSTVGYLMGGHADADDTIQDVLIEILRSVPSYRGAGVFRAWADRITVRHTMRAIKKRRRRSRVEPIDEHLDRFATSAPDLARRIRLRRRLAMLIGRLSEKHRAAIVLRLVHGYSPEEIAHMTDTQLNTIRDRLRTARAKLRGQARRDPVISAWLEESHHASRA